LIVFAKRSKILQKYEKILQTNKENSERRKKKGGGGEKRGKILTERARAIHEAIKLTSFKPTVEWPSGTWMQYI
jgi:hypothetical protein